MSTVEEKPTPPHLISPLPPVSAWSPNSSRSGDPSRFRKSSRREQRLSSLTEQQFDPQSLTTSNDGYGFQDNFASGSLDPLQVVFRLERNLRFLKEQHHVVTSSLHKEIDDLKRKNKHLQFKLVMGEDCSSGLNVDIRQSASDEIVTHPSALSDERLPRTSSTSNTRRSSDVEKNSSDLRRQLAMIESENRELGIALGDARNRNLFLSSRIEQMKRQASGIHSLRLATPDSVQVAEIPPLYAQRLEEFEDMMQQQKRENIELQTELTRLKAMIREILSSNKWSSEAYGLARSVLQEGHNGRDQRFQQRLPRIPIRPHEPQRLPSLTTITTHSPFVAAPVVRSQQSLPNIPTSNPKPRSNPSNPGQYNQRYKSPNTQKKKQRN